MPNGTKSIGATFVAFVFGFFIFLLVGNNNNDPFLPGWVVVVNGFVDSELLEAICGRNGGASPPPLNTENRKILRKRFPFIIRLSDFGEDEILNPAYHRFNYATPYSAVSESGIPSRDDPTVVWPPRDGPLYGRMDKNDPGALGKRKKEDRTGSSSKQKTQTRTQQKGQQQKQLENRPFGTSASMPVRLSPSPLSVSRSAQPSFSLSTSALSRRVAEPIELGRLAQQAAAAGAARGARRLSAEVPSTSGGSAAVGRPSASGPLTTGSPVVGRSVSDTAAQPIFEFKAQRNNSGESSSSRTAASGPSIGTQPIVGRSASDTATQPIFVFKAQRDDSADNQQDGSTKHNSGYESPAAEEVSRPQSGGSTPPPNRGSTAASPSASTDGQPLAARLVEELENFDANRADVCDQQARLLEMGRALLADLPDQMATCGSGLIAELQTQQASYAQCQREIDELIAQLKAMSVQESGRPPPALEARLRQLTDKQRDTKRSFDALNSNAVQIAGNAATALASSSATAANYRQRLIDYYELAKQYSPDDETRRRVAGLVAYCKGTARELYVDPAKRQEFINWTRDAYNRPNKTRDGWAWAKSKVWQRWAGSAKALGGEGPSSGPPEGRTVLGSDIPGADSGATVLGLLMDDNQFNQFVEDQWNNQAEQTGQGEDQPQADPDQVAQIRSAFLEGTKAMFSKVGSDGAGAPTAALTPPVPIPKSSLPIHRSGTGSGPGSGPVSASISPPSTMFSMSPPPETAYTTPTTATTTDDESGSRPGSSSSGASKRNPRLTDLQQQQHWEVIEKSIWRTIALLGKQQGNELPIPSPDIRSPPPELAVGPDDIAAAWPQIVLPDALRPPSGQFQLSYSEVATVLACYDRYLWSEPQSGDGRRTPLVDDETATVAQRMQRNDLLEAMLACLETDGLKSVPPGQKRVRGASTQNPALNYFRAYRSWLHTQHILWRISKANMMLAQERTYTFEAIRRQSAKKPRPSIHRLKQEIRGNRKTVFAVAQMVRSLTEMVIFLLAQQFIAGMETAFARVVQQQQQQRGRTSAFGWSSTCGARVFRLDADRYRNGKFLLSHNLLNTFISIADKLQHPKFRDLRPNERERASERQRQWTDAVNEYPVAATAVISFAKDNTAISWIDGRENIGPWWKQGEAPKRGRLIWLVRHAEKLQDINREWLSVDGFRGRQHDNTPLSDRGIAQSADLAKRFGPIKIDHIYSSPFDRCLNTAQNLLSKNPAARRRGLRINVENGLLERMDQIANPPSFQKDVVKLASHYPLVNTGYRPHFTLPTCGRPGELELDDGEREDGGDDVTCHRRMSQTLANILDECNEDNASIVIVSHCVPISSLHEKINGQWVEVGEATVSLFVESGVKTGKFHMLFAGDSSHLSNRMTLRPY